MAEWKPFDLTWGRSIYYCSECEESVDVPTAMGKPIYKYCPMCGAKMNADRKTEPQTCSFSDCDNFKNPDYERCIKCKQKQVKAKNEPQTEETQTDCAWKEPR